MPRPPRLQFPGAIYHVVTRGDGRRALFHDRELRDVRPLDRLQWQVNKICEVGSRYGSAAVFVQGLGRYKAYVAGEKWNGGEVREFESTDGGRTWRHSRDITQNSPVPNAFPRPVENASPELQIIWCSGHKGEPGKLHAWGEAGTLFDNPDPGIQE